MSAPVLGMSPVEVPKKHIGLMLQIGHDNTDYVTLWWPGSFPGHLAFRCLV